MKRRVMAILCAAAMTATLFAGCGAKTEETPAAETKTEEKEEEKVEEKKMVVDENATFIQPITSMPASLQPSTKSDDQVTKTRPVCTKLLAITADGVELGLLDKFERSDDGLKYTLHINEKAKWSDGTDITVDDLLFSVKYAGVSRSGQSALNTVNGQAVTFNTPDSKTLECVLPSVFNTYARNWDQLCILPSHAFNGDPAAVDGSDYFKKPGFASSGAYICTEINEDNIVFEARDDYFMGTPSVKKIVMKTIGTGSTADVALQNDEISYMRITTADQLEKYSKDEDYTVYSTSECRLNYIQVNPATGLTDDERKAIFLALNPQEIIDVAYGSDELAVPANSLLTPDQSLYDSSAKAYTQNIEEAKKLAQSSGLTNKTLNYIFNQDRANMEAVATIVQQELAAVGIKVNVQGMPSATFFKSFFWMWYSTGTPDTTWDLGTNGWDSERGQCLGQSISYFKSSMGFSDEVTAIANKVNTAASLDDAKKYAKELQEKTIAEYWEYPLTYTNYVMVTKNNIEGLDSAGNQIIPEFVDYMSIKVMKEE